MGATVSTANLRSKLWATKLWVEAAQDLFFKRFMGTEEPTEEKVDSEAFNNIVVLKEELLAEGAMVPKKGVQLTLGLALKLTGAGVTGDSTLEGSEEAINTYDFTVTASQIRNGVVLTGLTDEYKVSYSMRANAKALLKLWLKERLDYLMMYALSCDPTNSATVAYNRHIYAGSATTVAGLNDSTKDTGELFDTRIISKAKRIASKAIPKIRPVYVKGKPYYVILASPEQIRSLHECTAWNNAYQNAAEAGMDNPIFTGADSVYDGVVIHEYPDICTAVSGKELASDATSADNTATDDVARALFLGAQAGVYALCKRPFWVEKSFDYENQAGFATGLVVAIAKTIFNSRDYGCIALDTTIEVD